MKLTHQQKKEFESKWKNVCELAPHGICISSPCFCRMAYKDELKKKT